MYNIPVNIENKKFKTSQWFSVRISHRTLFQAIKQLTAQRFFQYIFCKVNLHRLRKKLLFAQDFAEVFSVCVVFHAVDQITLSTPLNLIPGSINFFPEILSEYGLAEIRSDKYTFRSVQETLLNRETIYGWPILSVKPE